MRIAVIGAGIGGLTAAAAFTRQGHQVEVLERASELREVGAGISLWPNALAALDVIGAGERVREQGLLAADAGIRASNGRWLSRVDVAEFERRIGALVVIYRPLLLDILRDAAERADVHLGVEVRDVTTDGVVTHSGGTTRADLVVGADGIRSIVRGSVWPEAAAPTYAGYAAWRMVTEPVALDDGGETWGAGRRFGFAPLPDGRVYCFPVVNTPAGRAHGGLGEIRRLFGDWHAPIPALLDATRADAVMYHDIYELPALATYVRGRVALLGDAAHAMTPNSGQGAGQAMEDAVVLAETVTAGKGLEEYDALRRERTQRITKQAHRIGAVAQWSSPVAVGARNALLRATPSSTVMKSLEPVVGWRP